MKKDFDMIVRSSEEQVYLSIVIPVYGKNLDLIKLYNEIQSVVNQITKNYHIFSINDGSPGNSWEIISYLSETYPNVKGINLSKNFGQHPAIMAGLQFVNSTWTIVMDCDLQDKPSEILRLHSTALQGYDIVLAQRLDRKDNIFKKFSSVAFYKVFEYLSGIKCDPSVSNFGIYSKKVIDTIRNFQSHTRSFGMIVNLIGFNSYKIPVEHGKRAFGKSSYSFFKRMSLATNTIFAFSNKPLRLTVYFGAFISFAAFLYSIFLFLRFYLYLLIPTGWTSLMVLITFMFGILFINLGVLGIYIGKIFDETRNTPTYIIKNTTFKDNL